MPTSGVGSAEAVQAPTVAPDADVVAAAQSRSSSASGLRHRAAQMEKAEPSGFRRGASANAAEKLTWGCFSGTYPLRSGSFSLECDFEDLFAVLRYDRYRPKTWWGHVSVNVLSDRRVLEACTALGNRTAETSAWRFRIKPTDELRRLLDSGAMGVPDISVYSMTLHWRDGWSLSAEVGSPHGTAWSGHLGYANPVHPVEALFEEVCRSAPATTDICWRFTT